VADSASTAEGIQLDETAGGAMGIEWKRRRALSDGKKGEKPQGNGKARKNSLGLGPNLGIGVWRGGAGGSLEYEASSLWAGSAEFGNSARV
jgi:hypothetical protein